MEGTTQTTPSLPLQSTEYPTNTLCHLLPLCHTLSHIDASEKAVTSACKTPFLLLGPRPPSQLLLCSKESSGNPGKINLSPPYASSSHFSHLCPNVVYMAVSATNYFD